MKRFIYLSLILVLALTLAPSYLFSPNNAYADGPKDASLPPGNYLIVKLTGNKQNATSYSIKGTDGNNNKITFTHQPALGGFLSSPIGNNNSSCRDPIASNQANEIKLNTITVTATLNGKQVGNQTYSICGKAATSNYMYDENLAIQDTSIQTGCFQVTGAYWKGDNGSNIPYNNTASAYLVAGDAANTRYPLTFDSSGNIAKKCGLPVGSYGFVVNYNPPASISSSPVDRTINQTGTIKSGQTWTLTNPQGSSGGGNNGTAGGGSTGTSDTSPTCESSGYGFAWALCGIINGMSDGVDWMYNSVIQPLLQIQPIDLSNPSADPTHAYAIWSDFRIYGDIFLVIALLVVVFGESIGGGIIDAYTAKKILPRLLAAAILINISIYIVALAVDVTNVIGDGINNLLQAPFQAQIKSGNFYVLQLHIGNVANVAATLTLAAIVAALFHPGASGNIAKTGFDGLLYFLVIILIPAFFIFLAIMATVILRRGLLLFLIFLAPIAFALYCLPNTEKYFRQWWDLLFKTLLVYPIIAVMFALGNILSVTIASSTSGIAGGMASIIGVVCMLAPLFLIPYSFRIAGGLLGRFHELATQTAARGHQGIIGDSKDPDSMRSRAQRRFATSRTQSNLTGKATSARLSSYIKGESFAERRDRLAAVRKAGLGKIGREFAESDQVAKDNWNNDQYLVAMSDRSYAEKQLQAAQAKANDTSIPEEQRLAARSEVAAWTHALSAASATPQTAATRMAALQQLATTGFQFDRGAEGYRQLVDRVASTTGAEAHWDEKTGKFQGFTGVNAGAAAVAMDQAQYSLRQAGRLDLGGLNHGTGYDPEGGVARVTSSQLGSAKPETFQAIGEDERYFGSATQAVLAGDTATAASQLAADVSSGRLDPEKLLDWHERLLGARLYATGKAGDEIDKQLDAINGAAQVMRGGGPMTLPQDRFHRKVRANQAKARQGIDPNIESGT